MPMYEDKCWKATCDICGDPYDNESQTETLLGFRLLRAEWRMDARDGTLFCPCCARDATKADIEAEVAAEEAES